MDLIYYGCLAVCMIICLANWRLGMFVCILMDVVRDPVRKISDSQSVLITVATGSLWLAVFAGAATSESREMWSVFQRYRSLRSGVLLLVFSLLPGAALSLVLYRSGYILTAIGLASYLGPLIGLAIGWTFPRLEKDIYKLLSFYVIINSIALVGTYLEWSGHQIPGLGGLKDMKWIRYDEDRTIELIAGFYRSPDIMGLHAAHVIVFGAMLAMRLRGLPQICWASLATWGMFCVLVSGRRKMIGIPLVFLGVYLLLSMLRGSRSTSRASITLLVVAFLGAVGLFFLKEGSTTQDYQQYASTIFEHGVERSGIILNDMLATFYQSGILGSGLGSATQGVYYSGVQMKGNWQEDGASRFLKELGVPGLVLLGFAAWAFLRSIRQTIRMIPPTDTTQQLQFGMLAVVAANASSFIMSHQQYSGDPMNGLLVLFLLGAAMGAPRIRYLRELRLQQSRPREYAPEGAELGSL